MEHRKILLTKVHKKNRKEDRIPKIDEKLWNQRTRHWKKPVKPKCSRRMHMRATKAMVSYHIQDVLPHRSVELWDTLCRQNHANHGVICSRHTGKDNVGSTDWWDNRHISIHVFWLLKLGVVQRRCRNWRNQTRDIPWSLPPHRISH